MSIEIFRLPGYNVAEALYEDATIAAYRGIAISNRQSVVIKLLKAEYPTLKDIARLKHEYEITRNLDVAGIIKPHEIISYNNGLALILEDFGGESLKSLMISSKLELIDFLSLAIQVTQTLGELHSHNIIHKNIKPHNIFFNSDTGKVKLTDFSIASLLSKENPEINSPNLLEGTLAYMSPEQTGCMNRTVDYRTDLYSLGVTFYELLTGQLPFGDAHDPMELVHCHIAKIPVSPHDLNIAVPTVIAALVMKLLAKTAEERYQSAYGLKADLEQCQIQLQTKDNIDEFPLCQQDVSNQFQIPQKLSLFGNESLQKTDEIADNFILTLRNIDENMLNYHLLVKELIANLTESSELRAEISGKGIDESQVLEFAIKNADLLTAFVIYIYKLSLSNWYGDATKAVEYAELAEKYVEGAEEIFINPVFYFHQSIALARAYTSANVQQQSKYQGKLTANLEKLSKWAEDCPQNYQHKYLLIQAEVARISGRDYQAMELYDQAIANASEQGYQQNVALANEIAAQFYLLKGRGIFAKVYLTEARYRYLQWGATRKVRQLDEGFCQLLSTTEVTQTDTAYLSMENARLYKDLQIYSQQLEISEAQEREKAQQLEQALDNLKCTQAQMVQSEKMSSLGQLVAGIAHEINNPVNFIYGNLTHVNEYTKDLMGLVQLYQQCNPTTTPDIQDEIEAIDLGFLMEDLPKMLASMKLGAQRIRQIVLSLRNFSRLDESEANPFNIHDGIDSTLMILQNRLKAKHDCPEIEVVKEYGDLPLVECYAGQLNQVFMNLVANAIDALEESLVEKPVIMSVQNTRQMTHSKGLIRIRTEMPDSQRVVIRIADNGPGMSETVKHQLFNPFFTTKLVGKGTGLGLSISYQIVTEKHGGQLQCVSAPGQGAEFIITLPVKQH